ncbi:MAG TPA: hypothetical protein VLJ39_13610 [Tepidisphaeraceae bacterium]|nr:hypothetical protein [Tepidisphaeraceae bacterium]
MHRELTEKWQPKQLPGNRPDRTSASSNVARFPEPGRTVKANPDMVAEPRVRPQIEEQDPERWDGLS